MCSNHARAARRYKHYLLHVPVDISRPDPYDDVAERLDRARDAERLTTAISRLSPAEQRVVSLCDLGDVSYAHAAQVLAIPIGTVRSRLSRAHAKLRSARATPT
jgi:RNA polymerase sigma-70 factor (ECF subfamily)